MTHCDVLVLSPHPDDAEIGCGGTLASLSKRGYKVIVADLTRGELGSRGTPEQRAEEAEAATSLLGLASRLNLELPDGALSSRDDRQISAVIECLRTLRPRVLLVAAPDGRHPDHDEGALLMKRALFLAGLRKFASGQEPLISPPTVLEYATRRQFHVSFVVDVTSVYETKLTAIRAFKTQLGLDSASGSTTLMSSPLTLEAIKGRDALWGSMIGTAYGEGFRTVSPLRIDDPFAFFSNAPTTGALLFPEPL